MLRHLLYALRCVEPAECFAKAKLIRGCRPDHKTMKKRPNKSPVIFHGWDGGIRSRFATPPHRGSEHSSLRMTSLRSKDFCSAPPHATRKFELPTLSHAKSPRKRELLAWLGWRDSNPRMHGPKPCALPLGDIPLAHLF